MACKHSGHLALDLWLISKSNFTASSMILRLSGFDMHSVPICRTIHNREDLNLGYQMFSARINAGTLLASRSSMTVNWC